MTVRLTIRTSQWRASVAEVAGSVDGLVPVVKGNGYGFGRRRLAALAAEFSDVIAVGNVHELDAVPEGTDVVVLTPTLSAPASRQPILTVGRKEHVDALAGWNGRVVVKVESSMHRYGSAHPAELIEHARATGLDVIGVSLHLPLESDGIDNAEEVRRALPAIDPSLDVWLSHLSREQYAGLPDSHRYRLRLGTRLWLGARHTLHLHADVLDVRSIAAGEPAGYRRAPAAADGHLVMVGAGTANGVIALPDGLSPFHFERQRLALHEAPHMHTAMCLIPIGEPVPAVGAWIDLQRPMTMTTVDDFHWL